MCTNYKFFIKPKPPSQKRENPYFSKDWGLSVSRRAADCRSYKITYILRAADCRPYKITYILRAADCRPYILFVSCYLLSVSCQLSTVNCQLSTVMCSYAETMLRTDLLPGMLLITLLTPVLQIYF